jgi:hypothetical protein
MEANIVVNCESSATLASSFVQNCGKWSATRGWFHLTAPPGLHRSSYCNLQKRTGIDRFFYLHLLYICNSKNNVVVAWSELTRTRKLSLLQALLLLQLLEFRPFYVTDLRSLMDDVGKIYLRIQMHIDNQKELITFERMFQELVPDALHSRYSQIC